MWLLELIKPHLLKKHQTANIFSQDSEKHFSFHNTFSFSYRI